MKNKKRIYDRHELLDLVNKEHSCIILKHCSRKIELQAKYLKDVKTGIKEALDTGLNKFDYSLNGILLDYRNLNVLADEWSGRIVGRFGEFLVTVTADFFVFDPKIGSLLEGIVNAKSNTHVGCLVHKRFNAMILKPDIEDNWNCENIQIGDKIIFTIVDHVFSSNIPHIEGVLATECLEKSSISSKKKLKLSGNKTLDLSENGKCNAEQNVLADGIGKADKPVKVGLRDIQIQGENSLTNNLENKSEKSKSKKRKTDEIDAAFINLMDVDESPFEVKKKKKKKDKDKSETFLETEKSLEDVAAGSLPVEKLASVRSETVVPVDESTQFKLKKKKREREKELEDAEYAIERKKKKKKDKRKDSEKEESVFLEKALGEKYEENVEESVAKSKKKKKREKEHSTVNFTKTTEQSEYSQSNESRLCAQDNAEINVNPVDLINQLMNVVPTDLMLPSEVTPVKGSSLDKVKSPKTGSFSKNETPEKGRSPNQKREEALTLKSPGLHLEVSPSKKSHLKGSLKSVKLLDKSLFSDSEASELSPVKSLREPVVVDVGSSQWKLGAEGGTAKREAPDILTQAVQTKPNNVNAEERKPKKAENQAEQKKTIRDGGGDSVGSIMKPSLNKKEKKDSLTKSVTWVGENVAPVPGQVKSTLLERFEKCLDSDGTKLTEASAQKAKDKKDASSTDLTTVKDTKSTPLSAKTKTERKKTNKENENLGLTGIQDRPQSKIFSLDSVDDTQLSNPVKTSTPKVALDSSYKSGGKLRKPRTKKEKPKKEKKASGGDDDDDERASMINALLEQAKESLGLSQ